MRLVKTTDEYHMFFDGTSYTKLTPSGKPYVKGKKPEPEKPVKPEKKADAPKADAEPEKKPDAGK